MAAEQRRATRYRVTLETQILRGSDRIIGMIDNLSLGGAQLRVDASPPLKMGDQVDLNFAMEELEQDISVQAQVRWVDSADAQRIGVQFLSGFRAKETWALNRLFSRCDKDE